MIGRLIDGRYQVDSRIARGGMATVYLATDLRLERQVAVKIMHGHLADDSAFRNRFIQEARSAARLAHPNVVSVFDQGEDSEMAYLVMEYLPGITLRDLMKDFGKLTAEQTVDVLDAVLRGLAAAHEAGIVHRDVKPENVLLSDDGRIKIGDFGLARATTANTASGQALLGTIAYLSPELLTRGVADERSDIYAAGIMLFEMLTGEQPFRGEQPMQVAYQHANDQVPLPSTLNDQVPESLDLLVRWSTERQPENRPADATQMLKRLQSIEKEIRGENANVSTQQTMVMPATSRPAAAEETRVIPRKNLTGESPVASLALLSKRRKRRGIIVLVGIIVIAALAGGLGWYFGAGPGALASVPRTAGMSPEQATSLLTAQGFTTKSTDVYSVDIPLGMVVDTKPAGGSQAQRGSVITVQVSLGPKIIPVPAFAGLSQADATALVKKTGFLLGSVIQKFSADVAKGTVIQAVDKGGAALPATFPEGGTVTLVVSAGPLPDVTNLPQAAAFTALQGVGLKPVASTEEFSDTVDKGSAIRIAVPDGGLSPGDSANVIISKGPDLVEVPNLVTLTIADALAKLTELGFDASTNTPAEYRDQLLVKSQSAIGLQRRGSTVAVYNP
ncbi:MAG: Stk1 family PASTA domain-containing Ser/Thr kinase [Actinobacteria bacterium]|nr:Stk1 family PASTA domain-containing Ser/Thr kinase [Actinomycetota bacterium]